MGQNCVGQVNLGQVQLGEGLLELGRLRLGRSVSRLGEFGSEWNKVKSAQIGFLTWVGRNRLSE